MNTSDIELISELLASRNTLYKSYNGLLAEIVTCLHKDVVTYRNKAVRAIRHLVREVPEVLDDVCIFSPIGISVMDINKHHIDTDTQCHSTTDP